MSISLKNDAGTFSTNLNQSNPTANVNIVLPTIGGTIITDGTIGAAATKATPIDGDILPILDSAISFSLKNLTWANLKVTLKTYFDTLYIGRANYASTDGTLGGTVKMRISGSTLYIRNDGTNA